MSRLLTRGQVLVVVKAEGKGRFLVGEDMDVCYEAFKYTTTRFPNRLDGETRLSPDTHLFITEINL